MLRHLMLRARLLRARHLKPRRNQIPSMLFASALASVIALPAAAADMSIANSTIKDSDGNVVGAATLQQTPAGVLLRVTFSGLPPDTHGFHIHETGACEAPSFKSAGGHLMESGSSHGYMSEDGPHLGDMPNIHVPDSGALELEALTGIIDMDEQLFDDDGAALVIHQGADDYRSQPSGAAGPRIACGVIARLTD